jgi:hypothetical protein
MNDSANIPANLARDLADAARRLVAANTARDFEADANAMESLRATLGRLDGPATPPSDDDLLGTLRLHVGKSRGVGGRWVSGTIGGHEFEALVFPEHAEVESYELGDSRISKLWLREQKTRATVANFDRGCDIQPTTEIARRLIDLLAAGLAETVFGK